MESSRDTRIYFLEFKRVLRWTLYGQSVGRPITLVCLGRGLGIFTYAVLSDKKPVETQAEQDSWSP